MEAILADTLLPEPFRKRKARRMLRQGAMKGRIETCDLRQVWESLADKVDHIERGGKVNRRKGNRGFQFFHDITRDSPMLAQVWPTVYDAVSNDVGLRQRVLTDCIDQELSRVS